MTSAPRERAARRRGLAMRERAKRRVGELEGVLAGLQAARRESRAADAAGLEDRAIALLRGWRAELDRPAGSPSRSSSPASHHLPGNSHGSSDLSSYIRRMLQLNEEEEEEADDATSKPVADVSSPKAEPLEATEAQWVHVHGGAPAAFFEGLPDHGFGFAGFRAGIPGHLQEDVLNCLEAPYFVPPGHLDLQQQVAAQTASFAFGPAEAGNHGERAVPLPVVSVAPSAFLQPKCALWDCPRPAQGLEWYHDYCSGFHATLAVSEGPPGVTTPVLRPGGIDLKDGPLFAALAAKTQGKNVGIPECPGAATKRSPWNAPELFDLSVLLGESLREWLFFDKPRRAFESGNRKQRSLPDYVGRGWHESRKQVMAEFGGLKRSYYMDPQPLEHYEWHLYEYEMSSCDACALYRLELKLADPRKGTRGKAKCDTSADHDLKPAIDERHDLQAATSTTGLRELEEPLHSAADFVSHNNDGRKMFSALIERAEVAGDLAYGLSYGYAGDSFRDLYGT